MSAVELLGMAQMLGIIAVLTVLMQLVWFRYRQRSLLTERVRQRLQQRTEIGSESGQVRACGYPPVQSAVVIARYRYLPDRGAGYGIVGFHCGCRGNGVAGSKSVDVLAVSLPATTAHDF